MHPGSVISHSSGHIGTRGMDKVPVSQHFQGEIMSFIIVEKPVPSVTVITLNRPERMNAMAFDVMLTLREQLEAVAYDNDTRAGIISGAGQGMCSGTY